MQSQYKEYTETEMILAGKYTKKQMARIIINMQLKMLEQIKKIEEMSALCKNEEQKDNGT